MDADSEYAGFSLAGHVLRNESVLDVRSKEMAHLPLMLVQPLASIQVKYQHVARVLIVTHITARNALLPLCRLRSSTDDTTLSPSRACTATCERNGMVAARMSSAT
eukprot:3953183-Prymnesium_polylepis.2